MSPATERPTMIPVPQASRRALLMGFAAAATPMAPALANALSEAPAAKVDPIFELIEKHKRACDVAREISDVWGDMPGCDPQYSATEKAHNRAFLEHKKVLVELLTCQPTSVAGVIPGRSVTQARVGPIED
jgi:hypothetical protein